MKKLQHIYLCRIYNSSHWTELVYLGADKAGDKWKALATNIVVPNVSVTEVGKEVGPLVIVDWARNPFK